MGASGVVWAPRTRSLKSQRKVWDYLIWAHQAGTPLQVDSGTKKALHDGCGCPSICPLSHYLRTHERSSRSEPEILTWLQTLLHPQGLARCTGARSARGSGSDAGPRGTPALLLRKHLARGGRGALETGGYGRRPLPSAPVPALVGRLRALPGARLAFPPLPHRAPAQRHLRHRRREGALRPRRALRVLLPRPRRSALQPAQAVQPAVGAGAAARGL